jgi:1-acyl-sn-glycerol-3-phosphate acyltransferase
MVRLARRLIRLSLYLPFTLAAMPVQVVLLLTSRRLATQFPVTYHRICMLIFGIEVEVWGEVTNSRPLLLVSNHVSYLDIPIMGSIVPSCFVAKREVAAWPFFGWLAKLQRTVFVSRRNADVHQQNNSVMARFKAGEVLVVFPEGTNTDGNHLVPFRPSVFEAAKEFGDLAVQPVSINCVLLDGVSAGRAGRQIYSWYGPENDLFSHLWHFMGYGSTKVVVEFHPPLDPKAFENRKELAKAAENAVVEGLSRLTRSS